jgi:type III pantothenate kinase
MFLAIDIGNSFCKFGIFESSSLLDKFSIPTERDYTVDELLFDRLKRNGERFLTIDTAAVCSVVPELEHTFRQALKKHLNVTPLFIDHTFDFGLKIRYEPSSAAGVDRLVNASAAAAKYGVPIIACSFGTATTFDVVNANSEYLGGAIAPGMRTMAEALHLKTSKLPLVAVEKPASSIGSTTEDSIRSGVFYGYIGLVEGVLRQIFEQLGEIPKVVGTGGFVKTVAIESSMIDILDDDLTLDGIRMLAERRLA